MARGYQELSVIDIQAEEILLMVHTYSIRSRLLIVGVQTHQRLHDLLLPPAGKE
jgi:hypothetical protein